MSESDKSHTINQFLAVELDVHSVEAILQYLIERAGAGSVRRKLDGLCGEQVEVRE